MGRIKKAGIKQIGFLLFSVVFTVGISLIIAELLVRLLLPGYRDQMRLFEPNDSYKYQLSSNLNFVLHSTTGEFTTPVKTNSLGYRENIDFPREKPENTFRILCLGDSFTFGYGVSGEEAYPKVLERLLRGERYLPEYQVINAGFRSGWTTDTQYLYLKQEGLQLQPDIVILGFFVKDILELSTPYWVKDSRGYPIRIKDRKPKRFFREKSALYHLLRERLYGLYRKEFVQRMTGGSGKSRMELSYEPVKMLIREMDRMISTQEGELVVVLIPHPGQLYESGTEEVQKVLMEFGKGEGIYVLDLLPYFRKDFRQPERQESCFFPLDGHWTAHGHAIAGSAIFEYLSTNGLIGAARPLIRGG